MARDSEITEPLALEQLSRVHGGAGLSSLFGRFAKKLAPAAEPVLRASKIELPDFGTRAEAQAAADGHWKEWTGLLKDFVDTDERFHAIQRAKLLFRNAQTQAWWLKQ